MTQSSAPSNPPRQPADPLPSCLDFRTTNSLWTSILVETVVRLGLTTAVICPGSRSAPLAIAFATHPQVEAIPALDERSAAFFALGLARQTGRAAALVCTSGTAGANFYPAVIEASESRVPLLILTADRPPELRDCNAGQTIDQQKLYGSFPNWYHELSLPELDLERLAYLRQTLCYAWERTRYPTAGVVHLNLPFRDPLTPQSQSQSQTSAAQTFAAHLPEAFAQRFFEFLSEPSPAAPVLQSLPAFPSGRGLILAGLVQPADPEAYCRAVAWLAGGLGVPVLAEGLSPLRNSADLNPYLVSTYDAILRHGPLADRLKPDWVLRLGEMPTSKTLRQWLSQTQPRQWLLDQTARNLDPLHGKTTPLRCSLEHLVIPTRQTANPYLSDWMQQEAEARQTLDAALANLEDCFEGKLAWLLPQWLPQGTPCVIANSSPVRDVEFFWPPNASRVRPFFNRGANGIDGTLSTALGVAHGQPSTVLLTGDLSLLHDTNGFLVSRYLRGHLTILLINNQGGGIFESLPVAQFDPPFEEFFATPQPIDFAQLCRTYGVAYELIQSWSDLKHRLNPLPSQGVRILELRCDRKADAQRRQQLLRLFSHQKQKAEGV
ncbi:MAG: 2-succinyl-5-enolpyruvyl-6-hydroxy-3-cyclohexene-1-carboxylic-acid synthase [Elainella sp.]